MEALAVLGVVCNVMQVIDFAKEIASITKAVYRGQSIDPSLTTIAARLTTASDAVSQSLRETPTALSKDEEEMLKIAGKCLVTASNLKAKLDGISGGGAGKGSFKVAFASAARRIWNRGKIEKLESELRAQRKSLELCLLHRTWTRSEAIFLKQDSGFGDLGSELRHLIDKVAASEIRLTDLVNNRSEDLKEHAAYCSSELGKLVISEGVQTRGELATRIGELGSSHRREAEHRKLLESLQYEGMNDRYTQIDMPHHSSFHWIFGPEQGGMGVCSDREVYDSDDNDDDDDGDDDNDDTRRRLQDWSADDPVVSRSSKSFLDWLHSEGPALYWISGKAGSGKSTLMKYLVEEPRTRAGLGDVAILHHFVCASGLPIERRVAGIYCSLLSQLLLIHPELSPAISDTVPANRRKKSPNDWSIEELQRGMKAALSGSPTPVFIFLDGIDEIDQIDQNYGLVEMLGLIEGYLKYQRLRVCISSRPEPAIKFRLKKYPGLRLQDLTRGDIRRYAWETLKDRPDFEPDDPRLQDLAERICQKSEGVFLWASLAVKSLGGFAYGDSIAELQARLEMLPGNLYSLFSTLWRSLNGDKVVYRKECARLLKLMLEAGTVFQSVPYGSRWGTEDQNRQISLFILMLAQDSHLRDRILQRGYCPRRDEWVKEVKAARKRLEARCAHLIDENSCLVTLIHKSAKEFLEATLEGQQILGHDESSPEDCTADLVSAEIALLRLKLVNKLLTPSYGATPLATVIKRLCRLCGQGRLTAARALELMSHVEDICKAVSWHPVNEPGLERPLHLDLLGEAVASGFLEFVVSALEKLEVSAPRGLLSPPYRCYLIITACVCGDMPSPGIEPSDSRTAAMVELLISRWTDMGHWGYHYSEDNTEEYMVRCTPMMALCRFAFSGGSPDIFCSSLEKMLRSGTGGNLQDVTTFMVGQEMLPRPGTNTDDAGSDDDSDADLDPDVYSIQMHCFQLEPLALARGCVVIEANMAYIIMNLLQRLMKERGVSAETIHAFSTTATRFSTLKTAKVRFLRPSMFWDLGFGHIEPMSEGDSSFLLESLMNFSLAGSSEYLISIPGLGRKIREVASRGRPSSYMELECDLGRSGHLVAKEEVQKWPPQPY